jgi:hypothetical protein
MDWTGAVLIALVVAMLVVVAVWYAASRIDRMHRRVEKSWDSLQLQLTRRASVALDLAHQQVWDPVTSIAVSRAAHEALSEPPNSEEHSYLTAALRTALGDPEELDAALADPETGPLLRELGAAWYRANLARRFLNDAVSRTRLLRSRRLVRYLRLAGKTAMPVSCDIDDAPPEGLTGTSS